MKTCTLWTGALAVMLAFVNPVLAAEKGDPAAELKELVSSIQVKLKEGKRTEAQGQCTKVFWSDGGTSRNGS